MIKKTYKAFVFFVAVLTVIIIIFVLLLWGINRIITNFQSTDYVTFYEEIDDETICSFGNHYFSLGKSIKTKGEKSHNDFDYDFELMSNIDVSIKRLNGLMTISHSKVVDKTIRFKISSSLAKGEMRIFVVKNNSDIIQEVEVGQDVVLEYHSPEEDTYTIKVLALDADMHIYIERTTEP